MKKALRRGYRISRYVVYRETLVDGREHFWSFTGAFAGIGLIAFCQSLLLPDNESIFLIGSFGASSVLVYGAIQSPLAQPRNLVGGHLVSAIIGVTIHKLVPGPVWVAAPLAVSLSIVAMQVTRTLHPPGGATALIAIIGTPRIMELGYWYVLTPVLMGCLVLLATALLFNNITSHRRYPSGSRFFSSIKRLLLARR